MSRASRAHGMTNFATDPENTIIQKWRIIFDVPRIGVISDTHGLSRRQALEAFAGVDRIIHAGDVGDQSVLEELCAVAPVTAVRGNTDLAEWARNFKETEQIQIEQVLVYILHDLSKLDLVPTATGIRVVISGHSHRPSVRQVGAVMYLNPGSAGPRRFNLPISCAMLEVAGQEFQARLISLE